MTATSTQHNRVSTGFPGASVLLENFGLKFSPGGAHISRTLMLAELDAALAAVPLDAVPQRFTRALEEASRLLEPKAVKIHLPGATIKNTADLDQWLAGVRTQVETQLKQGPVIL